ncbi:MAG TPA: hypothetical protein VJM08_02235 [Anaerolineales bacterium]|nr:hypothetical protein [Anaerolineales bacterium]
MSDNLEEQVQLLEARAAQIRGLLPFASRAFVMEFAGTPKSGKSTSVEAIRHFFTRHDFRVHVLSERAADCPIPMKGHLFFNTWCAASMLAELLANVETETDLIIIDRGLFDALVWLTLQRRRGELTQPEADIIESFLLLDRWRTLIDLAIVMSVQADEALARESGPRITSKGGSIMNPDVLSAINDAVTEATEKYGKKFRAFIDHPTTGDEPKASNIRLANKVLDTLEGFLNPEVLVVQRKHVEALSAKNGGAFGAEITDEVISCIESHAEFMLRALAEQNKDYVQIVPAGVLRLEKEVFVFERKEADPKYRLYGKTTLWQGTHVTKQDAPSRSQLIGAALADRISRDLFVSREFPTRAIGYCWDRDDDKSSPHFGLIYEITIDNPDTAVDLRKKAFRKRRGHNLSGQFLSVTQLIESEEQLDLESWSTTILKKFLVKE